jgi:Na+/glutamate symporter
MNKQAKILKVDVYYVQNLQQFITNILVQDKQGLFKGLVLQSEQSKKNANDIIYNQLHNQLQQLDVSAGTVPQLLHLVSLLIFQHTFQIPLYVSGKFVPMILDEIKPSMNEQDQQLLDRAHISIINNTRQEHLPDYQVLKKLGMSYTRI